jgi:hypothetical protein
MQPSKNDIIKQAISVVMGSLVRLMLKHGVTYGEFTQLAKSVFFSQGRRILAEESKAETASYLSVLTGLHRRDVTDFLKDTKQSGDKGESAGSTVAAILAKWLSDPAYVTEQDQPRTIPYSAADAPSFCHLVSDISKDIRPRAHADEMLRLGIVEKSGDDNLKLLTGAFIPTENFEQKLGYFKRNIGDHATAALENILSETPRFIDRSAYHGKLSPQAIAQLREIVEKDGMTLLKKTYRKAEELSLETPDGKDNNNRVIIGVYMYHEEKKIVESK